MKTSSVRQANRGKRRPLVYLAKLTTRGLFNLVTVDGELGGRVKHYRGMGYTPVSPSQFEQRWQQNVGWWNDAR